MNVSFGAKLVIDRNFPAKLPKSVSRENSLGMKENFENFLETPIVRKLTENDTITITEENKLGRYNLNMDCYDAEKDVHRNFAINAPVKNFDKKLYEASMIFNIKFFIALKSGCKRSFLESTKNYISRGIREYTRQYIEKHKGGNIS